MELIERELTKAAAGFRCEGYDKIVTGNWGCGAFGGYVQLKFLIQLVAASVCGRQELIYCYLEKQ